MRLLKHSTQLTIALVVTVTTAWSEPVSRSVELDKPAAGQQTATMRNRRGIEPIGFRMGSFRLFPAAEVGYKYDDNIFRFPEPAAVSDTIAKVRGSVSLNSDWSRHEFNAIASVDLGRYNEFDNEDYTNYVVGANGVLDVVRGTEITGKAGYMKQTEDRSSVNSRVGTSENPAYGVNPTTYDAAYVGVGFDRQPARLRTKVALEYETVQFDSFKNIFGGTVDNSDRDRGRTTATFRVGYETMPQRNVFIQAKVNNVDYDLEQDHNGVARDSSGYEITAGMSFDLRYLLEGEVFIGHLEQEYDDPDLESIGRSFAGFNLNWNPTQLTNVRLGLTHRVEESTEPTVSGYLSTILSIGINHELRRNINLYADAGYINNEFAQNVEGRKEEEDVTMFRLGGRYTFARPWYTSAEYRYEQRRSDIENQEYTNNQGLITLGAKW